MNWQPIETAPKDTLVMVYTPPKPEDWPDMVRIEFDHIDSGIAEDYWYSHGESYEHFCCVAKPEGSIGPKEKAPYTHWMPLPAAPDAVLEESKAMAASGDRVGALKHYRAGKGCSLEEARDAIYPGEATPDFPAGAIHNGRVHAERLEATGLECDAGSLQLCNDWVEFRRCFEHLAQWAEGQSAKESP